MARASRCYGKIFAPVVWLWCSHEFLKVWPRFAYVVSKNPFTAEIAEIAENAEKKLENLCVALWALR